MCGWGETCGFTVSQGQWIISRKKDKHEKYLHKVQEIAHTQNPRKGSRDGDKFQVMNSSSGLFFMTI